MLTNFKKLAGILSLMCLFCTSTTHANLDDTLIVSYATAHMNDQPEAVQGVLVTPSGQIFKTVPLSPFERDKIVIANPEEGDYSVFYQALVPIKPKICYIVGGIDVNLCNQPDVMIPFTPKESQIQGFTQAQAIKVGDTTLPIATFHLPD